jgi:hypothetical protein
MHIFACLHVDLWSCTVSGGVEEGKFIAPVPSFRLPPVPPTAP